MTAPFLGEEEGKDEPEEVNIQQQIIQQRLDILKDAFNNPVEELLEYEPWVAKIKVPSDAALVDEAAFQSQGEARKINEDLESKKVD